MNKVAILIDGGYFLKRLPTFLPKDDLKKTDSVVSAIRKFIGSHLYTQNEIVGSTHPWSLLYRTFYYDAIPYLQKEHRPISKKSINYENTDEAKFRLGLFDQLRRMPNMAARLGEVRREHGWMLKESAQKKLLKRDIEVKDLKAYAFCSAGTIFLQNVVASNT